MAVNLRLIQSLVVTFQMKKIPALEEKRDKTLYSSILVQELFSPPEAAYLRIFLTNKSSDGSLNRTEGLTARSTVDDECCRWWIERE